MAYQSVGTSRFYVNVLEWLAATGYLSSINNIHRTLPVTPMPYSYSAYGIPNMLTDKSFVAILGHNLVTKSFTYEVDSWASEASIVNADPSYDGFSISIFNGTDLESLALTIPQAQEANLADIGSIVMGTYYDMPHSPDLSLTLTRDYSNIKTIETKGGSTLSNDFGSKPPAWEDLGAWELHDPSTGNPTNQALSRSGRRIWSLSFSYLAAKDIMGAPEVVDQSPATAELGGGDALTPNLVGLGWDSDDVDDNDSFAYNLMNHNDFYSQVIHKTNGGQLPFIFQPDSSNNSPDAFAIAKLDMNSFKFEQVANGVYNIKLKIREVW